MGQPGYNDVPSRGSDYFPCKDLEPYECLTCPLIDCEHHGEEGGFCAAQFDGSGAAYVKRTYNSTPNRRA